MEPPTISFLLPTARFAATLLAGVVIGIAASLATACFVEVIGWMNDWLLVAVAAREAAEISGPALLALTVGAPTLGGLAVGILVGKLIRDRAPMGPADVIYAVQCRAPMHELGSGFRASLAALIALGTGASVGQYGPLVVLGGRIGESVLRFERHLPNIRPIAIASGVAAAISTAFHAPIAGLIFAHEVVLRHFALRAFAPVALAAATGYVASGLFFGRDPILSITFAGIGNPLEDILFAVEGLLAALLATLYMLLLLIFRDLGPRSRIPVVIRPAVAGLCVGLVAIRAPEILGIGQDVLHLLMLEGSFDARELAGLVVAKTVLTALCLGFGFVGGVFSPSLLIGALGGALFGLGVSAVFSGATSEMMAYVTCGMMAVASPVIGAPLTTILIVFELTGSYELTIAVMTSVACSNILAHAIIGRSLFDVQLRARGFDLSQGRDKAILQKRKVAEFVSQDYVALRPDHDVARLMDAFSRNSKAEILLIDEDGTYRGRVQLHHALGEPPERKLYALVDPDELVFHEDTSIWEAMEKLIDYVGEAVPLVGEGRRFLGVVPEGRVLSGYMHTMRDLRREENAGI